VNFWPVRELRTGHMTAIVEISAILDFFYKT